MKRQQHRRWRGLVAIAATAALVAGACADDDDDDTDAEEETAPDADFDGAVVTVFGPEVDVEQQSLDETFDDFREETGIDVQVSGADDFETQIVVDVDGGSPPDIALFPQPGAIMDFSDDIEPLSDEALSLLEQNFDEGWTSLVEIDGDPVGIPVKADLKSLVWYSPEAFDENGYEIPETFQDFRDLTDEMMADGNTPFCLGWESDDATGWPATDWLEDWMLRLQGPDTYDQWWQHEIPFDDPAVVETGEDLYDMWSQDGFVHGGLAPAASAPFREAGLGVLEDDCMMYRMSNFYAAIYGENDAEVGPDGDVNAFYLPGSEENPNIALTAGMYATAFSDDPAVMETMRFIASEDFANARAANPIGGFLSPNANVDTDLYTNEVDQEFGDILASADPARFDASDLMPGAVGSGSFWEAMINITTGDQTVEEAFGQVEDTWRE